MRLAVSASLLLAVVLAGPPPARAFIDVPYQLPAAIVGWCCNPAGFAGQFMLSASVTPYGPLPPTFPPVEIIGEGENVKVQAAGLSGEGQYATAASTGGRGYGHAFVRLRFTDPDGRPEVKLNFKIQGAALITPSDEPSNAEFQFSLGTAADGPLFLRFNPPHTGPWDISVPHIPIPKVHVQGNLAIPGVRITRDDGTEETRPADRPSYVSYGQDVNDSLPVLLQTGSAYLMEVFAYASGNAIAFVDPIVEPHPDNPNVVVHVDAAIEPASQPPFYWTTAEDLAALGFDPTPLVQLGVLRPSTPPAPPADTVAPVTAATLTPTSNAQGWNKGPVTLNLAAADNPGGSGVKEIRLARSGASSGSQVVPGTSAAAAISAEGETTVTYFAVDNAGNQEAPKTMTVRIDATPPVLAGLPAGGCTLWPPDNRLVTVAGVTASDGLSGLAAGAPVVTATSNEPEIGTGDGVTAPDIVIRGGAVQLRAEREGVGNGRIYTITASATDRAGNQVSATRTCTVPRDQALAGP